MEADQMTVRRKIKNCGGNCEGTLTGVYSHLDLEYYAHYTGVRCSSCDYTSDDELVNEHVGAYKPTGKMLPLWLVREFEKDDGEDVKMKQVPVTELMTQEYPHFQKILVEEIFSQLDGSSLQFADHIIGVSGNHTWLVFRIACLVNEHRKKYAIQKPCTVLSTQLLDLKYISLHQAINDALMIEIGIKKQAVFVHWLFDHPKEHHNNAPWKYTEEALEHWRASEKTKEKNVLKGLAESMGCEFIQSIILPVPRKQYAEFMKE